MAHTHGADRIESHGTYDGRFFEVDDPKIIIEIYDKAFKWFNELSPIASSISLRSSSEILGCFAGVSKINKNQHNDHKTPIPPKIKYKL